MAAKTPVSRIQEMSTKLKLAPPEYEIIFSRLEGIDPMFTYQCRFNGIVAEGSGRNKRDAKHESANELLKILEADEHKNEEILKIVPDIAVPPHNNKPQTNFVGELAFFCLEVLNFAEKPKYEDVGASGAAHDPTFDVECKVSSFYTRAKGSTKKQAKQLAAKIMLERLQQLESTDEVMKEDVRIDLMDLSDMTDEEQEKIKKFLEIHAPSKPKLENMNRTNIIFKGLYPNVPPGLSKYPEDSQNDGWDPYGRLKEVCNELGDGMLSLYDFHKIKFIPDDSNESLDDSINLSGLDINCDNDKLVPGEDYYTCSVTVHVRPMNLSCRGKGTSPEKCIADAAEKMLYLLHIFFFDGAL